MARSSTKSRRVGKDGERQARRHLEALGWYIASTEISGMSGDDIFAQDPDGKWWSIEVKNAATFNYKYIEQAQNQAASRFYETQHTLKANGPAAKILTALGVHEFTRRDFFVMWHPRGMNFTSKQWILFKRDEKGNMTASVSDIIGEENGEDQS